MFIFNHVPICRRCVFENWKQNIIEIDRFLVAFRSSVYTMLFIKFSFREIWVIHLLGGEILAKIAREPFSNLPRAVHVLEIEIDNGDEEQEAVYRAQPRIEKSLSCNQSSLLGTTATKYTLFRPRYCDSFN